MELAEGGDIKVVPGQTVSFVLFMVRRRGGTGKAGAVDQGLVQAGNEPGVGGQEAGLGDPGGGSEQAVEGVELHGPLHAVELIDDAAADIGAPEDAGEVAFGFGGLNAALDMVQEGIEQEQAALLPDFLEAPAALESFCLEVAFMPLEGRGAGAEFLAEGGQGEVSGQDSLVDVEVLGMGADGAFHGIPPESGKRD